MFVLHSTLLLGPNIVACFVITERPAFKVSCLRQITKREGPFSSYETGLIHEGKK